MLRCNRSGLDRDRGDLDQLKLARENGRYRDVTGADMAHRCAAVLGHQNVMSRSMLVSLMRGRVSEVAIVQEVLYILKQLTQSRHQRDDEHNRKDLTKH